MSGAGTKMATVLGNHYGPHLVMLQWHVLYFCTAVASRHALEDVNATVLGSDAQPFANVKVAV